MSVLTGLVSAVTYNYIEAGLRNDFKLRGITVGTSQGSPKVRLLHYPKYTPWNSTIYHTKMFGLIPCMHTTTASA